MTIDKVVIESIKRQIASCGDAELREIVGKLMERIIILEHNSEVQSDNFVKVVRILNKHKVIDPPIVFADPDNIPETTEE